MRSYAEGPPNGGDLDRPSVITDRSINISRRGLLRWSVGWVASAAMGSVLAEFASAATLNRSNTSRAVREEAVRQIPLRALKEPVRSRVQQVVTNPTIFRRLPVQVIPCDQELYLLLVRYPEIIVNMWQLMGVTKAVIRRTGAYAYDAQDGAGTVSQVELVYGTRNQHLFLAEGYYDGPLTPRRVTGRCVLLLSSAYSKGEQQRTYISNRLDVFLQLDKVGVELVAKTLHPLLGKTVDTNFAESARFIGQVSHVAETNGPGVQRLVTRLTKVEPEVRAQFAKITTAISQREALKRFGVPNDDAAKRLSDRSSDTTRQASSDLK